jgi:hypothetical protein
MSKNEKQLSGKLLLDFLRGMDDGFPPVRISVIETEKRASESERMIDALVDVSWNDVRSVFAVEARLPFNPKAIQEAAERITTLAEQLNVNPLILTPYLSNEQLRVLEAQQVSGIDLCGNGVIIVPDRLLIYRTGNPNKYPSSSPIRNVYRGTSSIVSRSFLLRSEYETAQELLEEVTGRGGEVTLSTVSKVCSSLADDLIIERKRQGRTTRLRLLQPEKLLNCLAENYEPPKPRQQFTGKMALDEKTFEDLLQNWKRDTPERVVRTGTSSSDCYATMAREPISRYYCTDLTGILKRLGESSSETDRFPNFQLSETDDPAVYFDIRNDIDASPLQAYLELSAGDKRERETAEQIRQRLLKDVNPSRRNP